MKHIDINDARSIINKARDLSGIGQEPRSQLAQQTIEAAFAGRDLIIEAAFRKEFGSPEDMTPEEMKAAAAQCHQESQMVDGINHFRFYRNEDGVMRLLVEVVQTVDGGTLSTSYRSEIGELGLGGE